MEEARSMNSANQSAVSLAEDVSRRAREVADRAASAATRASEWVREQKLAENATAYVTAHPGRAIGVALIAGALLSFLFTRKKQWP